MSWEPGTLVECIAKIPCDVGFGNETMPVKGRVYTVRENFHHSYGVDAIRLIEIVNPRQHYNGVLVEASFYVGAFRPLTDTRLAVFRKLLAPLPTKQPEDA